MGKQLWKARVRITADIEFLFIAEDRADAEKQLPRSFENHLNDREKVEVRTCRVLKLKPESSETRGKDVTDLASGGG